MAIDSDLDATAIPSVGLNYRFLEDKAVAFQAVFGGAINPENGGTDVDAAIGFGFSHPVGEKGSISVGHIWWREDGNGENGFYIGISLGADQKAAN